MQCHPMAIKKKTSAMQESHKPNKHLHAYTVSSVI